MDELCKYEKDLMSFFGEKKPVNKHTEDKLVWLNFPSLSFLNMWHNVLSSVKWMVKFAKSFPSEDKIVSGV